MSYATKYRFLFDSTVGTSFRIDIQKDGYSGSVLQRALGQPPHLRRESASNGICGTSLEIYAECATDGEFAELYTTDAQRYKVLLQMYVSSTWTTIWTGFVSPELYSEPEIAPPYDVCITAVDGLGELKIYDFPANGRQSLRTHLQTILAYTGLDTYATDFLCVSSLRGTSPTIAAATMLANTKVNLDHLSEGNCYDALQAIMQSLHMTITRHNNKWLLIRDSDVEVSSMAVAARNGSGTAVSLAAAQYGSMQSFDWWPVGQMETEVIPAKKKITVGYPYRTVESLFVNPETANPYCGVTPVPIGVDDCPGWTLSGQSGSAFYGNHAKIGTIQQTIAIEAQGSFSAPDQMNLKLSLAGIGTLSGPSSAKIRVKVFASTGSSTGPWLKRKKYPESDTDLEWVTSDSYFELTVPVGYYVGPPDPTYTEFEIPIPYMPGGNLTILLDGTNAGTGIAFLVGGVYLTKPTINGYQDVINIDNSAREASQDIELSFGDAPYNTNALASILNILSDSSGNLTTEWATSNFTGEYLSVIAMDYALAAALPRLQARGTLNVPKDTAVPAVFVNPDGIPMIFDTWDWNLFDDELDVKMTSVPAAEVTIDTEVKTQLTDAQAAEYAGGTVGSGSGGGSSYSGGGGHVFFEAVEDNAETVGAKALYDLYIDQDPESTTDADKNISEILRHLTLGNANGTPYLICDIALGSENQTFSGGYAPGGGGTGGSIATLTDVTLTSLAGGQILQYNATSSHWENKTLTLSLLTDVSTAAPQNGQALIYNSTTGLWTPQAIQTGGGAISLMTDVQLTNLANGDILVYNSTASKWVNASGYATQTWVTNQGYLTSSSLSGYATQQWVTNQGYITSSALNGYATEQWVTNKGYITSSALSGYATQTWVQNQNYLTSSDLNGYATQQWVTNKGYTTLTAVEAWAADEGFATQTWVTNQGYMAASSFTANNIVSTLGNTAVNRATADGDGNTISSTYLKLTGGTLTGDLRLKSGNYGLTLYFGDLSYVYLTEDTNDHLTINGSKGITLLTSSTSYSLVVGSSSVATPATIYGNVTTYGNVTIGDNSGTSACKTLTVYGRTSSSYPAITIYGVASSSTRYSTNIYRDATYLQIGSSVYISGNLVITGNSTSGQASDRRLKDDIKTIDINKASDLVAQLRPVEFSWNEKAAQLGQLSGRSRGFIADEYLQLIPEAGRKIWGEYDAIDYNQAIPYIVAAWQQQNMRIRILEGEISSLKAENELMRRRARENGAQ